ncbi:50S ribosomal protein L9 [Ignavigranum ruoffiae]|uniref:50S ribosomal protein L9 n=1 Tax=Ignavigranum ruoffiae TaxID=89093 RepID=UPI002047D80B|nr:50S ribosomal protein L9 [Ignavigranum ruoffiae]UPQ86370.1 50S ribosomal protein L9 [Ignavigranum ruoffiae]
MKVILLEDVRKQGKKGQVIEVSEGYGRNYLIKNNLAILADNAALNQLKSKKKAQARIAEEELQEAEATKKAIEAKDVTVTIEVKIGEDGRLFGAIPPKQIADELMKQYDIEIDRRKIQLKENITAIGRYNVPVKLHHEVLANIDLKVTEK